MSRKILDKQDVLNLIGDPKGVERDLQDYRKTARLASAKHRQLIEEFPKHWVAIHEGKVKAQGKTLTALMSDVDEKSLPRERIIVRFLDNEHRKFVL